MQAPRKSALLRIALPGLATLAALGLAAALPRAAQAQTVNFDDIPVGGALNAPIASGYQGFNWTNFGVANIPNNLATYGPDGYSNALVSGKQVGFNSAALIASVAPASGTFGLTSGYFTGAWNDGLTVTVQGLSGPAVLFTKIFLVSTSGPTLETFNWAGLTNITFASAGGTPHGYTFGSGNQFAVDNLTFNPSASTVPEPSSVAAFAFTGLGAAGLILRARRRTPSPAA